LSLTSETSLLHCLSCHQLKDLLGHSLIQSLCLQRSGLPARQSPKPKEISYGFRTTGDVVISAPRVAATALLHLTHHC